MILPDTNIWIDHLRTADSNFTSLLLDKRVRLHPYVLGEIALGLQGSARRFVTLFSEVRQAVVLDRPDILSFAMLMFIFLHRRYSHPAENCGPATSA
jgi:predicted nucleic acid-binding protein